MLDAWRKVRSPASVKARAAASAVGTSGGRNPEIVAAGERMSKDHHAIDAGGRDVTIVTVASLDRFQAQPKWEISVNETADRKIAWQMLAARPQDSDRMMATYRTFENSAETLELIAHLCRHHDHLKTLANEYAFMRQKQTYDLMADDAFQFDQDAMNRLDKSYFTSLIVRLSSTEGDHFFAPIKNAYVELRNLVEEYHPNANVDIYFDSAHITIKSLLDNVRQNAQELSKYVPVVKPLVHDWLGRLGEETRLFGAGLFTNLHRAKGLSVGVRFYPSLPLIQILRGVVGTTLYQSRTLLPILRSQDTFHTMLTHSTGFRARQLTLPFSHEFVGAFRRIVESYDDVLFGTVERLCPSDVCIRNGFSDKLNLGEEVSLG